MNEMASLIRDRREWLGMSRTDLAARLYVSRYAVRNWECGINHPMKSTVAELEAELAMPKGSLESRRRTPQSGMTSHYWPTQKAYDLRSVQWPPNLQAFLESR